MGFTNGIHRDHLARGRPKLGKESMLSCDRLISLCLLPCLHSCCCQGLNPLCPRPLRALSKGVDEFLDSPTRNLVQPG